MNRSLLNLLRARDEGLSASDRREAFGLVVDEYQDAAYAVAYAILNDPHAAQDAAVEAFVEAWRNLGALRGPEAFAGWLRTLVRTRALRRLRDRRHVGLEVAEIARCDGLANDQRIVLSQALARLPEIEREAVVLFYIAGLTRDEAASFMGTSLVAAKKRLARGLARLRKEMINMPSEDLGRSLPSRNEQFRDQTLLLAGQFAELLASGRPILLALDDCIKRAGGGVIADAFRDMKAQVLQNKAMADAMLRYPNLFDPSDAAAVLVGEETGTLDTVLRRLAAG